MGQIIILDKVTIYSDAQCHTPPHSQFLANLTTFKMSTLGLGDVLRPTIAQKSHYNKWRLDLELYKSSNAANLDSTIYIEFDFRVNSDLISSYAFST